MKVFVAGAPGALGGRARAGARGARPRRGRSSTRSASKQDLVRNVGARPVVADALDPEAVAQAGCVPPRRLPTAKLCENHKVRADSTLERSPIRFLRYVQCARGSSSTQPVTASDLALSRAG